MTQTARTCGECSACCTVTPVLPLNKPADTRCKFQRSGPKPCACYETRPACCEQYRCEWLNGDGTEAERPDRSGVVAEVARDGLGRPAIATLISAPGFTDDSIGARRAATAWRSRGAVVILVKSGKVIASREELQRIANSRMVFADGVVIEPDPAKIDLSFGQLTEDELLGGLAGPRCCACGMPATCSCEGSCSATLCDACRRTDSAGRRICPWCADR